MTRLVVAALLTGCQPRAWPLVEGCDPTPPPPGEVRVAEIRCPELQIDGGESRNSDLWLANARFAAALRHPQDALTLAGVGGATVIDAAPWTSRDRLHEVAPLVDGGWLRVEEWTLEPDGVRVAGTVTSLPDRPAVRPGARREVRWRVEADTPWLRLEGADGLWIHAAGAHEVVDGQVIAGDTVYGHDGVVVEDLGGALRVDGATGLLIAPLGEAWGWLAEDPVTVSGEAVGASSVVLLRGSEVVGRLPVDDDAYSGTIDASVTGLQARASGRAPGPIVPPGEGVALALGGAGTVVVEPAWTARPRPISVAWSAADGRSGRYALPADGGALPLGAGSFDLTVTAGPAVLPASVAVDLADGDEAEVAVALQPAFDPGDHVQAAIGLPADRSRTFRGSNAAAAWLAAMDGFDFAVFTPEDEVASVGDLDGSPPLAARNGALLPARDGTFAVWSWPWSPNGKNNAHGVADIAGEAPADVLSIAWGGPTRDRFTMVDLAFLERVGLPHELDTDPAFVRLAHPGVDGAGWARWFDWLDARALLVPTGPVTWVEVEDPELMGAVDVERGLLRGRVSAGSGPLIVLSVGGAAPGDVLTSRVGWRWARVDVEVRGEPLDHLVVVTPRGTWAVADDGVHPQLDDGWVVAMGWDDDGGDWAVTAPVWLDSP